MLENKIQRVLRQIKHVINKKLYKRLYATSSKPRSLYGIANVHKLKEAEGVGNLSFRPITSNIGNATNKTVKYIADLLAQLEKSRHTI